MIRSMKAGITAVLLFILLANFTGCRYGANRAFDFADIFQLGAGVTAENPFSGMVPPSLGVHAQATEFINAGAFHFSGYSAEWDGRGFFAGPETRTRFGLGPLQIANFNQNTFVGYGNYFKQPSTLWNDRMNSVIMRFADAPAKELEYDFWSDCMHIGAPLFHRGWQYWENVGVEAAICEPLCTHLGFTVRAGVDVSEISDLILGFFCLDFKQDDLTREEFTEMTGMCGPSTAHKPASDYCPPAPSEPAPPPPPAPAPPTLQPPPPTPQPTPGAVCPPEIPLPPGTVR